MNQNTLKSNLKALINSRPDLSEAKLSRELDIPQPTLHRLVDGSTSNPTVMTLLPIAKYFNVSLGQIFGLEPLDIDELGAQSLHARKNVQVPLIPWDQIYSHKEVLETISPRNWHEWITTSLKLSSGAFAIEVASRTMPTPYQTGSVHIIEPCEEIRGTEGQAIIICSALTKTAHIKTVLIDGDAIWLCPINRALPPEKMDDSWLLCGIIRQHILTLNINGAK